jgi:hypothetical protein
VSLWVRELVAGVKSPPGGDSRPLRRHDGEREGGLRATPRFGKVAPITAQQ